MRRYQPSHSDVSFESTYSVIQRVDCIILLKAGPSTSIATTRDAMSATTFAYQAGSNIQIGASVEAAAACSTFLRAFWEKISRCLYLPKRAKSVIELFFEADHLGANLFAYKDVLNISNLLPECKKKTRTYLDPSSSNIGKISCLDCFSELSPAAVVLDSICGSG